METVSTVENVVDARTAENSTVRVYNAAGFEIVPSRSNSASTRFDSLIGGKPGGVRHAEYGPAAATASLIVPFAETVQAARPYTDSETDGLL